MKTKVYRRRWIVIFAFTVLHAILQHVWCVFSSVMTDAWHWYGFADASSGETAISMLTMAYMVGMVVLYVPSVWVFDRFGWYKSVVFSGVWLTVWLLLRGVLAGHSYAMLLLCTCGCAAAQPFMINAFGMIAAKWFPPEERGIANGIGMISTFLGVVMAQFGVPFMITNLGMDIPGVLKVFGLISIPALFFFIFAAKEAPPLPPADEMLVERADFAGSFKLLFHNKQFISGVVVFCLLQGVYFTFTTYIEAILQFFNDNSVDVMFVGTLGTIITIAGSIATIVLPVISDRTRSKKRLPLVRLCEIGSILGLALVIFGHSYSLMIVMACMLGVFLIGVTPVLLVYSFEAAYPVSEGVTEGIMQGGANGFGAICILCINGVFHGNHLGTMLAFIAAAVVSLLLSLFAREASLQDRKLKK